MKAWAMMSTFWSILFSGLVLPPLSVNGFDLLSLEYVGALVASILIGSFVGLLSKFRIVNGAMFFFTLVLYASAYYASPALWVASNWVPFTLAFLIGVLTYIAVLLPREMLVIFAAGAGMYVVSAAVLTPSLTTVVKNNLRNNEKAGTPVLHVILDEHAGIAAFPDEVISDSGRYAYMKPYLDRGFLVFTHAYTADFLTQKSIARLFNKTLEDPTQTLRLDKDPPRWTLLRADNLNIISSNRNLRWYGFDRLNLAPDIETVSFIRNLNLSHIGSIDSRSSLSFKDRLVVGFSSGLRWLYADFKSPLAPIIAAASTSLSRTYRSVGALSKLDFLSSSISELAELSAGGWYGFIHVLVPHAPVTYNENCKLLPVDDWISSNKPEGGMRDISNRNVRYAGHLRQAKCTSRTFLDGVDLLKQQPSWSNMTVLVHGDHGSRIGLEDLSIPIGESSSEIQKLDAYSTFLAIRLPGSTKGRIINEPVRIDDIFNQLIMNDFNGIDLSLLPQRQPPF